MRKQIERYINLWLPVLLFRLGEKLWIIECQWKRFKDWLKYLRRQSPEQKRLRKLAGIK